MMKKILSIFAAVFFVVSFAVLAIATEEMFSLKGPVVSVDAKAKTVTVHSVEGVTTAADNRWKGNVTFVTNDKTQIMMGKEKKAFSDLKAGQELKVKFHEREGKSIAVEIIIMAGKKASGY